MIKERDIFIDFLKGLCIICVVLTHNLPDTIKKYTVFVAWGSMAVPLFLLLQSYHFYKSVKTSQVKGVSSIPNYHNIKIKKVWNRILKPFIVITFLTGSLLVIGGHEPEDVIKEVINHGGLGPGSYYVWIYLQFLLLLPISLTLINKWGGTHF